MKNTITTTLVLTSAALLVCASASAVEKTNAVARPLAAFADEPMKGKDPFFPDSARRFQAVAKAAPVSSTNSAPAFVPSSIPFSLKGISGTRTQRLALVNNATLAVGEAAEVRSSGQAVKILLREIRDRSVLIEIVATGELKEIRLRDGI
jgi:hypothetical protein